MVDEAGFSIVTRGFDNDGSITTTESTVQPKQIEPQPIAPAVEEDAPMLEVAAERIRVQFVEDLRAPSDQPVDEGRAPAMEDRVATGDVVVEAIDPDETVQAACAAAEDDDLEPDDVGEPAAPVRQKKLKKKDYEKQLIERHLDWRGLERKVQRDGLKVVVLVEGRDNGKKGGIVNRIADFSDARICRVARVEPPNGRERSQWFFQPYVAHLPAAGEIVLFDGSWYGRAALERATGRSDPKGFAERLSLCAEFESMLQRSGLTIIKCWLSADEGAEDLAADLETLGRRWNFDSKDFEPSIDLAGLKEQILGAGMPWQVVQGRGKRAVRVDAIRAIVAAVAGDERTESASSEGAAADPPSGTAAAEA